MSLFMKWLQQLPENDLMRLLKYARKWSWLEHCGGPSPEDLVHEAFLRYIDGRRKMPPDSEFDKRLVWVCNTIKSIASHACEALQNQPSLRDPVDLADEEETGAPVADGLAADCCKEDLNRENNPTQLIAIGQELERCLRSLLKDRPRHAGVLELKLQGYSHTEIAQTLGLCNARVTQLIEEIRHLVLDFYQHNT